MKAIIYPKAASRCLVTITWLHFNIPAKVHLRVNHMASDLNDFATYMSQQISLVLPSSPSENADVDDHLIPPDSASTTSQVSY